MRVWIATQLTGIARPGEIIPSPCMDTQPEFPFCSLASGCKAPMPSAYLIFLLSKLNEVLSLTLPQVFSCTSAIGSEPSLLQHANFHRLLYLRGAFLDQQQLIVLSSRNGVSVCICVVAYPIICIPSRQIYCEIYFLDFFTTMTSNQWLSFHRAWVPNYKGNGRR